MRRFQCGLLATVAAFGFASVASAADLPVKAPMVKTIPPYNWGGWYVGGNVGYGWGVHSSPDVSFIDPAGPPTVGYAAYFAAGGNVTPNVQQKGVIGGLQLGYNWQSNNFVYGLVTDIQASGMKASGTNTVSPGGSFVTTNQSNSVQTDWFGTLRAKFGVAQNNWLFYATGGLAYGQVKTSGNFNIPLGPFNFPGSNTSTRVGWAAGAGIDYGLTPNWTIGVEYLYVDLGRVSHNETGPPNLNSTLTISNHAAANIARATLNYKF